MFSRIHASASTKSIILSRIAFGSPRIARVSPAYLREYFGEADKKFLATGHMAT